MPEAQVKMNVRDAGEKASIIDVQGELTAFAESVLMDAYNQASDGHVRAIILNFEELEYMNSSGIGLLARGEHLLRAAGRHHARRGRPHFRLAARRCQALDGRDGPVRR